MRILIQNGTVWNGAEMKRADVLTQDHRIDRIAESILCPEADFVYDARGKIVSCGLVDVHAHLRGISPDELGICAEAACFPFGVTAAADASMAVEAPTRPALSAVKTRLFAVADIHNDSIDPDALDMTCLRAGNRIVGIKVYFDTRVSDVRTIAPLCAACAYAHRRNLPVMVHTGHSPVSMGEIVDVLESGDILSHAFHGGPNAADQDGFSCLRRAKERGIIIDAGFAGHVHTDFRVLREAISCGCAPDVLGTDITRWSAFKRGGRYGMTMCMSMARACGMGDREILLAVTSSAARALSMWDSRGCLREGGCADIAVLEYGAAPFSLTDAAGNTLASETGYRCTLTVADGDVVYREL